MNKSRSSTYLLNSLVLNQTLFLCIVCYDMIAVCVNAEHKSSLNFSHIAVPSQFVIRFEQCSCKSQLGKLIIFSLLCLKSIVLGIHVRFFNETICTITLVLF